MTTVTLNSALPQNWVVCTVCGRTQVARTLCAIVRATACTTSWSCAHARLVARARYFSYACHYHDQKPRSQPQKATHVATPNPCCDIKFPLSVSRHQISPNSVATSKLYVLPVKCMPVKCAPTHCLSQYQNCVAT